MPEVRRSTYSREMAIPSAILYHEDLLELEQLVENEIRPYFDTIRYRLEFKEACYEGTRLAEVLEQAEHDGMKRAETLKLSIGEGPGVYLALPIGSAFAMSAKLDGPRFMSLGVFWLFRDFLRARAPWYAWLAVALRASPFLFALASGLLIFEAPLPRTLLIPLAAWAILSFALFGMHAFLGAFPHQRVYLRARPRLGWSLEHTLTLLGLLVAILAALIPYLRPPP